MTGPQPTTAAGPVPGGGRVWAGAARIAAATALFGVAHSALAGAWAKAQAVALFGDRTANALYRPAYLLVTVVLVGLLLWYARRQPGRELYRVGGPSATVLRGVQVLALAFAGWAVAAAGLDFLTGWDGLSAWWRGAADVPRMPDGQGPAPAGAGAMRAVGPFALTRHPLNWFALPLLWLNPRMTTRLLAFALAATAYLLLGSVHLEGHLLDAYGAAYRWYQERVPFLVGPP